MNIHIRPAAAKDQPAITRIVREARVNPMDLKWPSFVVAADLDTGEVVGIGQVKQHRDGSRELASIVTVPAYRRHGVAHQVVDYLLGRSSGDLYLTCLATLRPFYEQFGFRVIDPEEMPPYFRRLKKVVGLFMPLMTGGQGLLVMKRNG